MPRDPIGKKHAANSKQDATDIRDTTATTITEVSPASMKPEVGKTGVQPIFVKVVEHVHCTPLPNYLPQIRGENSCKEKDIFCLVVHEANALLHIHYVYIDNGTKIFCIQGFCKTILHSSGERSAPLPNGARIASK